MCDKLSVVFCNGNEITSLKVGSVKTRLNCSDNRLSLANLPLPGSKYFIYAPQKGMPVAQRIWPGETIDLSAQDNLTGLAAEAQRPHSYGRQATPNCKKARTTLWKTMYSRS